VLQVVVVVVVVVAAAVCLFVFVIIIIIIVFYFFLLYLKKVSSILLGKYAAIFLTENLIWAPKMCFTLISIIFLCLVGSQEKRWILVRPGHNVLKECTFHSKLALHVISLMEALTTLELINTEKFLNGWLCVQWAEPRWLGAQIVCSC